MVQRQIPLLRRDHAGSMLAADGEEAVGFAGDGVKHLIPRKRQVMMRHDSPPTADCHVPKLVFVLSVCFSIAVGAAQ